MRFTTSKLYYFGFAKSAGTNERGVNGIHLRRAISEWRAGLGIAVAFTPKLISMSFGCNLVRRRAFALTRPPTPPHPQPPHKQFPLSRPRPKFLGPRN